MCLVELAKKESTETTDNFLQWFVKEQLEEVSSMDQLLKVHPSAPVKTVCCAWNNISPGAAGKRCLTNRRERKKSTKHQNPNSKQAPISNDQIQNVSDFEFSAILNLYGI